MATTRRRYTAEFKRGAVAERLTDEYGLDRVASFPADCADANVWPEILNKLQSTWGGLYVAIANVGDGRSVADALLDAARFAQTWRGR